jgi:hypothetical protein
VVELNPLLTSCHRGVQPVHQCGVSPRLSPEGGVTVSLSCHCLFRPMRPSQVGLPIRLATQPNVSLVASASRLGCVACLWWSGFGLVL